MEIVKTHPSVMGLMNRLIAVYEDFNTARFSDWAGAEKLAKENWENALARQTVFTKEDVFCEYENRFNVTIKR